jgi:hypothetical protein
MLPLLLLSCLTAPAGGHQFHAETNNAQETVA